MAKLKADARKGRKGRKAAPNKPSGGGVKKAKGKRPVQRKPRATKPPPFAAVNQERLKNQLARQKRRDEALPPKKILLARALEQTPFGPVSTSDSPREKIALTGEPVQLIGSNQTNYNKKGDLCDKTISYKSYAGLVKHIDDRVARMILIEVLLTTIHNSGPNTQDDEKRNLRGEERQANYQNESATVRRVMAVMYALIVFSEEQRTAGAKSMRAALELVIAGTSAKDAFVGTLLASAQEIFEGDDEKAKQRLKQGNRDKLYEKLPLEAQTAIGGMKQYKSLKAGKLEATKGNEQVDDAFSDASVDEAATETRRTTRVDKHLRVHEGMEDKRVKSGKAKAKTVITSDAPQRLAKPARTAGLKKHDDGSVSSAAVLGKGKAKEKTGKKQKATAAAPLPSRQGSRKEKDDAFEAARKRKANKARALAPPSSLKRPRDFPPDDESESKMSRYE